MCVRARDRRRKFYWRLPHVYNNKWCIYYIYVYIYGFVIYCRNEKDTRKRIKDTPKAKSNCYRTRCGRSNVIFVYLALIMAFYGNSIASFPTTSREWLSIPIHKTLHAPFFFFSFFIFCFVIEAARFMQSIPLWISRIDTIRTGRLGAPVIREIEAIRSVCFRDC